MKLFALYVVAVLSLWFGYVILTDSWSVLFDNLAITATMIFGSMIAGASSEGGGAIAFPVLTLLLEVPPSSARNFSFAIQSIGMTSATLLILGLGIKIEKNVIIPASLGGIVGVVLGTLFVVPHIHPATTKLFFVSVWLSFGIVLYLINRADRATNESIELFGRKDFIKLAAFGIVGGLISSMFGNGIDILTFVLLTLHYNISEKIATPTSVILMTINTVVGFSLHSFSGTFGQAEFNYWIAAIPVVVFGAPLGAFVISMVSREHIAKLLYIIVAAQYVGALFVIRPSLWEIVGSVVVVGFGLVACYAVKRQTILA